MDRAEGIGGETSHGAVTRWEALGCSFKGGQAQASARSYDSTVIQPGQSLLVSQPISTGPSPSIIRP